LERAARELQGTFGRIDAPWGEVNRLRRGTVDLPLGGAPDTLRAVYTRRDEDGRRRGIAGDSFVLLVEWDRAGRVSSRSIHQYGSATADARSPHYADQAPLFAGGELKPVYLDEADIRAHLEREYRPGGPPLLPVVSH
jgi:penicillin amidase/acyl-homoserine-lactone acylase